MRQADLRQADRWLIPDTNVVLHEMDLLEKAGCPALNSIIILETVAQVHFPARESLGIY